MNLSYGSKGDEVKELQTLLNNNGYTLDVDGDFGTNTLSAVRDYQTKNNLDVDGIVGNNTWGALTKASTTSTETPTQTTTPTTTTTPQWSYDDLQSQKPGEFTYDPYEQSYVVNEAEALLQQQLSQKPGEYQSAWQAQLNETLNQILNREKFSYDLNGDALYQQYKDQYVLQGQQAMMDTMGQAAALTGGYGNSYAQTAGQQTYQGYLQQLNDRIPELYQLALDQYNREGDEMYNQASLMASMEEQDYGRYRDQVSDWYTETERLTNEARYQAEQDYNQYMDGLNLSYQQYQDQVAAEQWAQSMAYQQERDKIADEQWQAQFDEAIRQYNHANGISSGGTTGSTGDSTDTGKKDTGSNIDNGSLGNSDIKKIQDYLGLSGDGLWGDNSRAAAQKKWGVTSADEAWKKYQAAIAGGGSFTGSTYSEAAAYLKANGLSTSGLMTQSEWQRHKNNNDSAGGEHEASSYQEYLAAYIYGKTKK